MFTHKNMLFRHDMRDYGPGYFLHIKHIYVMIIRSGRDVSTDLCTHVIRVSAYVLYV